MAFINITVAAAVLAPDVSLAFGDGTTANKTITAQDYIVDLVATSSDIISTYKWERKIDSGAWQALTSTTVNTKQDTINTTGVYTYRAKVVRESDGMESNYSNEIIVDFTAQALQAPTAEIDHPDDTDANNAITVDEGTNITVSGANSVAYDGATITDYTWEIITRPANDTASSLADGSNFTISNLIEGTYDIKLTVTDSNGNIGSDTFTITVQAVVTTTTYSAQLAPAATSGDACYMANNGGTDLHYIDVDDFANCTKIWDDSSGTVLSPANYYSDGVTVKYWDGSAFTGSSQMCSV